MKQELGQALFDILMRWIVWAPWIYIAHKGVLSLIEMTIYIKGIFEALFKMQLSISGEFIRRYWETKLNCCCVLKEDNEPKCDEPAE